MKKRIKKRLSDFMKDESGIMSKENIFKVGIGTISALGMLSSYTSDVWAAHTNTTNHMSFADIARIKPDGACYQLDQPAHINTTCHNSHSAY